MRMVKNTNDSGSSKRVSRNHGAQEDVSTRKETVSGKGSSTVAIALALQTKTGEEARGKKRHPNLVHQSLTVGGGIGGRGGGKNRAGPERGGGY